MLNVGEYLEIRRKLLSRSTSIDMSISRCIEVPTGGEIEMSTIFRTTGSKKKRGKSWKKTVELKIGSKFILENADWQKCNQICSGGPVTLNVSGNFDLGGQNEAFYYWGAFKNSIFEHFFSKRFSKDCFSYEILSVSVGAEHVHLRHLKLHAGPFCHWQKRVFLAHNVVVVHFKILKNWAILPSRSFHVWHIKWRWACTCVVRNSCRIRRRWTSG